MPSTINQNVTLNHYLHFFRVAGKNFDKTPFAITKEEVSEDFWKEIELYGKIRGNPQAVDLDEFLLYCENKGMKNTVDHSELFMPKNLSQRFLKINKDHTLTARTQFSIGGESELTLELPPETIVFKKSVFSINKKNRGYAQAYLVFIKLPYTSSIALSEDVVLENVPLQKNAQGENTPESAGIIIAEGIIKGCLGKPVLINGKSYEKGALVLVELKNQKVVQLADQADLEKTSPCLRGKSEAVSL